MRERPSGAASPASPSPLACGSPAGQAGDLAHPPPHVPDHELLQPIGRGAYGEVWLARNVVGTLRAVKVVYRHDFGDEHPFDREFRGIQKFEPISRSHPGLVNILQIGRNDAGGYFYYVMELADDAGEMQKAEGKMKNDSSPSGDTSVSSFTLHPSYFPKTLRHDLKTRGRLPAGECIELGLALTSALDHLHQHGLVHRDVKPSNIIFVNGQPKLADIGLVAEAGDSQSIVGTEGYLAPEGPGTPQADLFSLGKLLYEMSTGQDRRQYPDLPVELKDWQDAPALRELNEVVLKACAKDVASRYQSAGEMHADLSRLQAGKSMRWRGNLGRVAERTKRVWPLVAALLLLLLVLPWILRQQESWPPVVPTEKASVFVLPFRNEGTNGVPDDLRGRITDAFIDSLALIEGVRRSPRKSGWVHQDEDVLRRSLAETNDMRHILTGRIRGESNVLTLTLRLHERRNNKPAWMETFAGTTNDIIALEWSVLEGLAQRLSVEITEAARPRISQLLSNNLEALAWCRKGWELQQSYSTPRLALSKEAFLHATELDPNDADAHYGALLVYRVSYDKPYRDVWPELRSRARMILQMDDTHWRTRYYLSWARIIHDYDWEHGMPEVEAVLRAWPVDPGEWALYHRVIGRLEEARGFQAKQDALGPQRGSMLWHSVAGKYIERRYDETVQGGRRIQRADPETHLGFLLESWGHIGQRNYSAALEAIQRGLRLQERQDLRGLLGYVYARMGETNKARVVLEEFYRLSYAQPYWVARIHAALGETEQALTWLEKAYEDRSELLVHADIGMGGLRLDEAWNDLRSEPRFGELLRKTGLDKWPR